MQEVAQQMDAIERDFGDDYRIGRVVTLVEVIAQNPDRVELRIRAGQYPWVTLGMLDWAKSSLENGRRAWSGRSASGTTRARRRAGESSDRDALEREQPALGVKSAAYPPRAAARSSISADRTG